MIALAVIVLGVFAFFYVLLHFTAYAWLDQDLNLVAVGADIVVAPGARVLVPTGLTIALPSGFEAQVRPRSGLALKHGVTLLNTPGTIDADYRGEIGVILINHGAEPFAIKRGDRIAQMIVAPVTRVVWREVDVLGESGRGTGGFGSTGTGIRSA